MVNGTYIGKISEFNIFEAQWPWNEELSVHDVSPLALLSHQHSLGLGKKCVTICLYTFLCDISTF